MERDESAVDTPALDDYGLQRYVDFTPNPNQQFEIRRFNFRMRRA